MSFPRLKIWLHLNDQKHSLLGNRNSTLALKMSVFFSVFTYVWAYVSKHVFDNILKHRTKPRLLPSHVSLWLRTRAAAYIWQTINAKSSCLSFLNVSRYKNWLQVYFVCTACVHNLHVFTLFTWTWSVIQKWIRIRFKALFETFWRTVQSWIVSCLNGYNKQMIS